jgi:hypothetical protein
MRNLILGCLSAFLVLACQDSDDAKSEFTGNESTYALAAGSQYNISGTATFREKVDGSTLITVELDGTSGNIQHPVHLHLGKIAVDGADIAALLTPVTGSTGKSETIITRLADDSQVSYAQLVALDACIKVHLAASGPDKDIILAGGNIGKAAKDDAGRIGFGTCKSE